MKIELHVHVRVVVYITMIVILVRWFCLLYKYTRKCCAKLILVESLRDVYMYM